MDLRPQLLEIEASAAARIDAADDLETLADIETEVVGKRSALAEARRGLGAAPAEDRRELGMLINRIQQAVSGHIDARRRVLSQAAQTERFAAEALDLSLPGRIPRRGTHHLITETLEEIVDILVSIGYTMTWGPEVETAWHNFDALNMPATHPARMEWDTMYVGWGETPEDTVLRTHTSPLQARYMLEHPPPVYVLGPGRVFRRDTFDATHTPVFHQVEGLAADEGITFADLRGTLAYLAREFFGPNQKIRLLPNHFRFTEPSAEGHVSCFNCDGSGCRICGHTGWIELFGCGMVHPHVFESVGYDPNQITGFAFGLGADRAAQIRHGITDLRYFWEGDLRTQRQFS